MADDKVLHRIKVEKEKQLVAATEYCKKVNCKGYAALKTGEFPLIRDHRTINRRLLDKNDKNHLATGDGRKHLRLITNHEEE